MKTTGWQEHSRRGAISTLKAKFVAGADGEQRYKLRGCLGMFAVLCWLLTAEVFALGFLWRHIAVSYREKASTR